MSGGYVVTVTRPKTLVVDDVPRGGYSEVSRQEVDTLDEIERWERDTVALAVATGLTGDEAWRLVHSLFPDGGTIELDGSTITVARKDGEGL